MARVTEGFRWSLSVTGDPPSRMLLVSAVAVVVILIAVTMHARPSQLHRACQTTRPPDGLNRDGGGLARSYQSTAPRQCEMRGQIDHIESQRPESCCRAERPPESRSVRVPINIQSPILPTKIASSRANDG